MLKRPAGSVDDDAVGTTGCARSSCRTHLPATSAAAVDQNPSRQKNQAEEEEASLSSASTSHSSKG